MAERKRQWRVWLPHNAQELIRAYRGCWIGMSKKGMRDPAGFEAQRAILTLDIPKPPRPKRKTVKTRRTK